MARKTVKVAIPTGKPDEFVKLAKGILKKHQADGSDSPLTTVDMALFDDALKKSDDKRTESQDLRNKSEARMQEAYSYLGIGKGQNIETPGTVYHLISRVRDQLLVTYRGNEEKLSEYGFPVVVGTAASPTKKKG